MEQGDLLKALESIGFSKNESLVYLDLLKTGGASAGDVSKNIQLHRPNVYDILKKLSKKGIVTQTTKEGKKIFFAVQPRDLLNYLKQKEYDFEKVLPVLEHFSSKKQVGERKIIISEGVNPLRNILFELLEERAPIYVYGIPKEAAEKFGGIIKEFHRKRISRKILMRHIYNRDAEERVHQLNKKKYTEAKTLPEFYNSNTTTMICKKKVILIFWEEPVTSIKIEDSSISKSYENYFELLWKSAKVPKK